jgi:hypothetical protein
LTTKLIGYMAGIMNHHKKIFMLLISFALTACGGSGNNSSVSGSNPSVESNSNGSSVVTPTLVGSPEGLWKGTTNTDRTTLGFVLDTNEYWIIYSIAGNSTALGGVLQGSGVTDGGTFTSDNGKDINMEGSGARDISLIANYQEKSTFNGVLSYPDPLLIPLTSLSATYDADYEQSPSLADIAGNFAGTAYSSAFIEPSHITISSTGALTGSTGDLKTTSCIFSGTVTPRFHGNVYDISITFGGGGCVNGTDKLIGVAYFDSANSALTIATLNQSRTGAFLYGGTSSTNGGTQGVGYDLTTAKKI